MIFIFFKSAELSFLVSLIINLFVCILYLLYQNAYVIWGKCGISIAIPENYKQQELYTGLLRNLF